MRRDWDGKIRVRGEVKDREDRREDIRRYRLVYFHFIVTTSLVDIFVRKQQEATRDCWCKAAARWFRAGQLDVGRCTSFPIKQQSAEERRVRKKLKRLPMSACLTCGGGSGNGRSFLVLFYVSEHNSMILEMVRVRKTSRHNDWGTLNQTKHKKTLERPCGLTCSSRQGLHALFEISHDDTR